MSEVMARKKFIFFLEAKKTAGEKVKYPVYSDEEFYYVNEHKIEKGKDIEEIEKLFKVKVTGPVFEKPLTRTKNFIAKTF
ncbi:MAG: hypothetical protein U5N58_13865 [Actinomycetota bacterium]|nr:hypothetical protein [Actinomycetota bacterium]